MKLRVALLFLMILVALSGGGCAVNRATATLVDPSFDLSQIKSAYLVRNEADRNGVVWIIAEKLKARGLEVETGTQFAGHRDVVVTYRDTWMWDITMYLKELTVYFRDSKSSEVLVSGSSYHTSLTRLDPDKMVTEVLGNMYAKARVAK